MKKTLPFFSFVVLVLSLLFLSCSKEIPVTNDQNINPTNNAKINNIASTSRINPLHLGSISAVLEPVPVKAVIRAHNDHYMSEEVEMIADGSFVIQYLPPDEYRLLIMYVPSNHPGYLKFQIENIIVPAGEHIKLGVINLPGN